MDFINYQYEPSVIYVYDLDGSAIAEIEAASSRSLRLNDVGEINFSLSIFDEKLRREIIEFGRFVLVRHPRLPDWAGPIDTPREWGDFQVVVHGYTAERMLYRRIGEGQKLTGSAGSIFERILEIANQQGDTLIRPGSIWKGGADREQKLEYRALLKDVQNLATLSKNDFGIEPEVGQDERLIFRAYWWEKRGVRSPMAFKEGGDGANIEGGSKPFREQGEIWNDILGYGEGATWISRPKYEAVDEASKRRFGLYRTAKYYQGVTDPATLKNNVETDLLKYAYPRNRFGLAVLDVGETWLHVRLGNTHTVSTNYEGFNDSGGVGFDGEGRIKSIAIGEKGKAEIVLETIDEEEM